MDEWQSLVPPCALSEGVLWRSQDLYVDAAITLSMRCKVGLTAGGIAQHNGLAGVWDLLQSGTAQCKPVSAMHGMQCHAWWGCVGVTRCVQVNTRAHIGCMPPLSDLQVLSQVLSPP